MNNIDPSGLAIWFLGFLVFDVSGVYAAVSAYLAANACNIVAGTAITLAINELEKQEKAKDCSTTMQQEISLCNSLFTPSDGKKNGNCIQRAAYRKSQCDAGVPKPQRLKPFPSGEPI